MFESFRLSNLPSYAKLFVGLFAALMLCVCFWAGWLYTVEKGLLDESKLPAYLQNDKTIKQDMKDYLADSSEVLAPIWDSTHKGQEVRLDSVGMVREMAKHQSEPEPKRPPRFKHNLGLAHTHINGQTLLFFAMGLLFLFTSVKPSIKKIVFWAFAVSILIHNIGLSGMGYASIYDDLLAISGVIILVTIAYMAFVIFMDLAKKPTAEIK